MVAFLAGIGGLAVQLAQHDQPTEVAPPECHEVRMDVPAVRVPPVRTAEHGAGKRMRFVEPVDAVVEPVRANRVCVGIEQYDVRVTRRKHPARRPPHRGDGRGGTSDAGAAG